MWRVSSAKSAPFSVTLPAASAPSTSARLVMLLLPGTAMSRSTGLPTASILSSGGRAAALGSLCVMARTILSETARGLQCAPNSL